MTGQYTSSPKSGWARFIDLLEDGFRFPKGRNGNLVRPRYPRKLAGVCSGLAEHFGWNVSLLRVLVVVLTVASTGLMVIAYLAAWVIIPEGQYSLSAGTSRPTGTSPS